MKSTTPASNLAVAAVLGFLGVALGAFGAHVLAPALAAKGMTEVWKTAVLYHFVHTLALLALVREESVSCHSRFCFIVGIVLFSGSLYALALGAPRWVGPITPIGGLFLLVGWAGLAWTGIHNLKREES